MSFFERETPPAMRESWSTVGGLAVLGFAIAAGFYVFYTYTNSTQKTKNVPNRE
jgi:hypothetical protein